MRLSKKVTKKYFVPDDPDKAWIKIRHLKVNEVRKIESKANDMFFQSDSKGDSETRINFDPYIRSKLFAHESLEDWGNMLDVMGKPLLFKAMNIDKAAEFIIVVDGKELDFYAWIDDCRNNLTDEVAAESIKSKEN